MKPTENKQFYSAEAAGYEEKRYGSRYGHLFREIQRASVSRAIGSGRRFDKALDVATGTGQMLDVLAGASHFVLASDLTPDMLRIARERIPRDAGVSYCVADAAHLPYADGTFDVVASSRFLHLFEPHYQAALLSEMARVLKPGGMLIVDFYSVSARNIFAIFIWPYRIALQKRAENDYRVSIGTAKEMLQNLHLKIDSVDGLGNFGLIAFLWLPRVALMKLAGWFGIHMAFMSEQFLVVSRKP